MKFSRIFAFLLCLALGTSLLVLPAAAADPPALTAKAALLVDVTYGEDILYASNAHQKMYPAGITKVMTGLLVLEAVERGELSLEQPITVTSNAKAGLSWNDANADLRTGEIIPLSDLLRLALIPAASDACNMLAEVVSGSIADFVDLMNRRAAELGCENTHFVNPHGNHSDDQYTTAWDIYLFCREAMKNATFREIVATVNYYLPATNFHSERWIHSTNSLISNHDRKYYLYQYATGLRTGYTEEAGRCIAASATNPKSERELICIILGCERTPNSAAGEGYVEFTEAKALMEWGFNSFSRRAILATTDLQGDLPVTLSQTERVAAQPAAAIEATLPNDVPDSAFTREVQWNAESVEAPVQRGQVLGTVTVSYNGVDYGTVELVAVADVERSELLYRIDQVRRFFGQLWVQVLLLLLLVLISGLVLWIVFFRKRPRTYTSRSYGYANRGKSSRRRK